MSSMMRSWEREANFLGKDDGNIFECGGKTLIRNPHVTVAVTRSALRLRVVAAREFEFDKKIHLGCIFSKRPSPSLPPDVQIG
jgi:hypothetical protein